MDILTNPGNSFSDAIDRFSVTGNKNVTFIHFLPLKIQSMSSKNIEFEAEIIEV